MGSVHGYTAWPALPPPFLFGLRVDIQSVIFALRERLRYFKRTQEVYVFVLAVQTLFFLQSPYCLLYIARTVSSHENSIDPVLVAYPYCLVII